MDRILTGAGERERETCLNHSLLEGLWNSPVIHLALTRCAFRRHSIQLEGPCQKLGFKRSKLCLLVTM